MPISKHQRSGFWIINVIALLLACGGCSHTAVGLKLSGDRIAFIRDGVTPRAEVLETLGLPLYDLQPERTIAYAWETEGSVGFGYTVVGSYKETYRKHDRFLFCVRFDEHGIVSQHGETRQSETESSNDTIRRWLSEKSSYPK
jgi:hypothetical protein